MTAISDSSPLILFDRLGRLELLHSLFAEILIPPAVHREVAIAGAGRPGARGTATADWVIVRNLTIRDQGAQPLGAIGAGETEAIALALALSWNEPILLDDLAARRIAERTGLLVVGSGGVLVLAKDRGLIPSVTPVLEVLLESGLYLSRPTCDRILAIAGEPARDPRQPDV